MNSKDYVLKHDFGYGRDLEIGNLNKLELRNIDDLEIYIAWSIRNIFSAEFDDNNLLTFENNSKIQIKIEQIKV